MKQIDFLCKKLFLNFPYAVSDITVNKFKYGNSINAEKTL